MSIADKKGIEEKMLNPMNGLFMLFLGVFLFLASFAGIIGGAVLMEGSGGVAGAVLFVVSLIVMIVVCPFFFIGLKIIAPNEALVLLLFGKYHGTIKKDGFFYVNPFCVGFNPTAIKLDAVMSQKLATELAREARKGKGFSKKISLKAITLNNDKQKINDSEGNPIEIGVNIVWRIINTAYAAFNVDNYENYISAQADLAIRNVARLYPYDVSEEGDEKSLRGSSNEISNELKKELQSRVEIAGIEIIEARISHLAYAQEIAAAMLQRQQASAIVAARQKIVEGAVGMVEMALDKLKANDVIKLDDEKKATMVSNLLVVLCGNRDAQPVINSGSIY